MEKEKMKKRKFRMLKILEPYFVALSYMFIGFFIALTGVQTLPQVAAVAREGSLAPLFYSLSIIFGFVYFSYYKVFKIIYGTGDDI